MQYTLLIRDRNRDTGWPACLATKEMGYMLREERRLEDDRPEQINIEVKQTILEFPFAMLTEAWSNFTAAS
jgi:hypothetical protein